MTPDPDTRRAYLLRQAMQRPEKYLAAALAEWPDEDLAYAMRADPGKVWQLRLCNYPQAEHWHADTQQFADLVDADVGLLLIMLRTLGVRP
jgi:hypothetical protein